MKTVFLSAGDASGDSHVGGLVEALRERHPELRFVGLGGDEMERAGVELVAHQRDLAVGGFIELASSARRIAKTWTLLGRALEQLAPDLVVLSDSGGFNIPFARRSKRASSAPILYYVSPQVWAWRRGRIRKLEQRVDRMAVIFPFELTVYRETNLPVEFVGHPLVEKLRALAARLDRETARRELGFASDGRLVAILPGSRRNEIVYQLPVQLAAAATLHRRDPRIEFALGLAPTISQREVTRIVADADLPSELVLDVISGRTADLIVASDVVLAKPGTVTVEVTLLDRPMVVVGRASWLTAAIVRRAVKLPSLTMPNLIAEEPIVPEFLQERADPFAIAAAVEALLAGPERERQLAGLARVRECLGAGGAAQRTARIAEKMLGLVPA